MWRCVYNKMISPVAERSVTTVGGITGQGGGQLGACQVGNFKCSIVKQPRDLLYFTLFLILYDCYFYIEPDLLFLFVFAAALHPECPLCFLKMNFNLVNIPLKSQKFSSETTSLHHSILPII